MSLPRRIAARAVTGRPGLALAFALDLAGGLAYLARRRLARARMAARRR